MRIAPLKWTYKSEVMKDCPKGEMRSMVEEHWTWYTIFVKDTASIQFTLSPGVSKGFVKRIVEKLNGAMETQRYEFLWGLANMHNQGTLYGDDDE